MTRYEILISCERLFNPIAPNGCRDPIDDCRQPQFGIIELDHAPTIEEIDRMNEINNIAIYTQTGCKRFLGSTACPMWPPYDNNNGIDIILK
jgi:hypothetical protein